MCIRIWITLKKNSQRGAKFLKFVYFYTEINMEIRITSPLTKKEENPKLKHPIMFIVN